MIYVCNKKSGVLGLSGGVSSDFRNLAAAADEGNEKAIDALDTYAYRVAKYIGSYAVAMKGVDVIAFTAGIGENNVTMRTQILKTNALSFALISTFRWTRTSISPTTPVCVPHCQPSTKCSTTRAW